MSKFVVGGVVVQDGPRTTEQDTPFYVSQKAKKEAWFPLVTTAGSASLYAAQSTSDNSLLVIPAYSFIVSCAIFVDAAFTSTATATGIDVGLVKASDLTTEVDFNGLIAVGGVGEKANLTAHNADAGDGALIGNDIGANDACLYALWAGGTDTLTGTAMVYVEWIEPPTTYLGDHA